MVRSGSRNCNRQAHADADTNRVNAYAYAYAYADSGQHTTCADDDCPGYRNERGRASLDKSYRGRQIRAIDLVGDRSWLAGRGRQLARDVLHASRTFARQNLPLRDPRFRRQRRSRSVDGLPLPVRDSIRDVYSDADTGRFNPNTNPNADWSNPNPDLDTNADLDGDTDSERQSARAGIDRARDRDERDRAQLGGS